MRKFLLIAVLALYAVASGTGCCLFRDRCRSCDKFPVTSGHAMSR